MISCKFLLRSGIVSNIRLLGTTQWNLGNERSVNPSDKYYKQQGLKQDEGKPADWESALPFESIPGPKKFPLLGNIPQFLVGKYAGLDFLDVLYKINKEYGKIATLKLLPGGNPFVLLYDPVDLEKMLRNEGIWPYREIMPSLCEYRTKTRKDFFDTAPGILTVHGETWFNTRTKVNPILMQPRTIKRYTESIDTITTDIVKIIKRLSSQDTNKMMPKNFESYIQNWALESVGYVALSRRFGCLDDNPSKEAQQLINSIDRTFSSLFELDFLPTGNMYKKFNTKTWKMFINDMDFLTNTTKKYIDKTIKDIQNRKGNQSDDEQSVLEKLLAVDEKIAITMVIDMIMAGIDSTTKSAAAALYYLAKNKEIQNKLRAELRSIMPTPDSPLSKETLEEANYLRAVIKESMRMSPIAVGTARTSAKEIVLGGYRIPKGVDVMGVNCVLSRSENNYEQPNEFLPERWLRSTTDQLSFKNTSAFVTLPFGFGPRSCVGQRLANLVLQVLIGKVIRNFDVEWPHKDMKFVTKISHGCADPLEFKMVPVM